MTLKLHIPATLAEQHNLSVVDDDGEDVVVVEAPKGWCEWRICNGCRGDGTSSAYLGAFTQEDFDQEGHEFFEDYMAGRYDRTCEECGGGGKVLALRTKVVPRDVMEAVEKWAAADAAYRREQDMERRMGA